MTIRFRHRQQRVSVALLAGVLSLALAVGVGCGWRESWRQSWQSARMPDQPLRLAGAQIPVELVESWADRCRSIPFTADRVGKVRFSHDGFRALVKGQANVACTSSSIAWYDAKDYIEAHGNLPIGWRVAWDAFGVYVHPDNPIKHMEVKQFRDILRSKIKNWAAVDGPPAPITLYGPHRSTRAGRLFMQVANLFLADPPWKQFREPGDIIDAVKTDPMSIGMTELGYAEATPYLGLRGAFDKEPIYPTKDSLDADKWPLLKTIWVWTTDPPDPAAAKLVDYLFSEDGQAAIRTTRYTPVPREKAQAVIDLKNLPTTQPSSDE